MMYGSTGGGGSAFGGGVLHMKSQIIILDGSIEADGSSGKSSLGGGSGGSVLLEASVFGGTGIIQANGGDGGSTGGGGGSGGRIALYFKHSDYTGLINAFGGDSAVEAGAAGTIYQEDTTKNYKILKIENKGRRPSTLEINTYDQLSTDAARTWITSSSMELNPKRAELKGFTFTSVIYEGFSADELILGGGSHLGVEPELHRGNIRLHTFGTIKGTFEGGSYGFLHTGPSQLIQIEKTDYYIPMNLKIYKDGYLKLPSEVMLHKNSLSLNGYLIGVRDIKISNCLVNFGNNAGSTTKGVVKTRDFYFDSIGLLDGAYLRFLDTSKEYTLRTNNIVVNTGGTIEAKNFTLIANDVVIREGGIIKLDGQGVSCRYCDVYNAGSGGSHAGNGGLGPGYRGARRRSEPFDFVYTPVMFGEAGCTEWQTANCNGGRGGGKANISISGRLHLDGSISSRYIVFCYIKTVCHALSYLCK